MLEKLQAIESELHGEFKELATPGRSYVREGALVQIGNKYNNHFILCNDIMLCLTDTRTYNGVIQLKDSVLEEYTDDVKHFVHRFRITTNKRVNVFVCESAELKDEWIRDFKSSTLIRVEPAKKQITTFKDGFLMKRSKGVKKTSKRWFLQEDDILYCFKTKPEVSFFLIVEVHFKIL